MAIFAATTPKQHALLKVKPQAVDYSQYGDWSPEPEPSAEELANRATTDDIVRHFKTDSFECQEKKK